MSTITTAAAILSSSPSNLATATTTKTTLTLSILALLTATSASADTRMAMGAGPGSMPEVVVFGAAGAGPQSFLAFDAAFRGGVRVAVADVNGDGVSDVIAGAGSGSSSVKVFSGATGAELRSFTAFEPSFTGGVYVAAGDVTGDGTPDLVVSAGGSSAQGHVKVFSGRDGSLIDSYFAYDPGFQGGVRVAVGDVNGDGRADVVTAAGAGGGPLVRVFSGAGHSLLHEYMAFEAGFQGGVFVAAGDLDGDGRADIIASTDAGSSPRVAAFSVATLRPLGSVVPYESTFQGGVRVAAGDVNGDGVADVITGPGAGMASQINVYAGPGFGTPSTFLAFAAGFTGGVSVATTVRADVLLRDGFE